MFYPPNSGAQALGDHMHAQGVRFGTYTDEGWTTCKHYPGSQGHEEVDAATFAAWGVDYLKVDGCHRRAPGMAVGYPAMGAALRSSGPSTVTLLPSSDSSQFPSTCSSLSLVSGCSNVAC